MYSLRLDLVVAGNRDDALATKRCNMAGFLCQTGEIQISTVVARYVVTQVEFYIPNFIT
jgi:hypothetical protein